MSLFTMSGHEFINSTFTTVEEVEQRLETLIVSGCNLAELARQQFAFLQDVKECRKRLVMRLQLIDKTFKTSDKSHKFYNGYDAYATELRKIGKANGENQEKPAKSAESVAKQILTLLTNNPDALPIVKAAIC